MNGVLVSVLLPIFNKVLPSIPLANDHHFAHFPLPPNGIDPKLGSVMFYLEDMEEHNAVLNLPSSLLVKQIEVEIDEESLVKEVKMEDKDEEPILVFNGPNVGNEFEEVIAGQCLLSLISRGWQMQSSHPPPLTELY